jgi:hypothetical protein
MAALKPDELRTLIQDTLKPVQLYSPAAEELLLATAAQESHLGEYRRQIGGPALGIFQMEPATFQDIWANYLKYKPALESDVCALASTQPPRPVEMVTNDGFAVLLARIHYLRAPEALPAAGNLCDLWTLYKLRWNTPLGAATKDQFFANYRKYVDGPAI